MVCVVQVATETNKPLNFVVLKLAVHSNPSPEGPQADDPLGQLLQHSYIPSVVHFLIATQMQAQNITSYTVIILSDKYCVAFCRYSAARVGGWLNGLR